MQLDRLPAQPSSSSPSPAQPPARRGLVAAAIVGAVALAGAVTRIAAAPPVAATPVAATPASSLSRVGVVNVQVVRDKIQEYKAFVAHFKDEQTSAELMARGHQADLKLLNDKLGQLKPDSDQAEDQLTAAQEKLADFNKDEQQSKAKLQREYNKQTKTLFVEIQQVVADLSKRKGLDLVIVQPEVQLPVNVQNVDPPAVERLLQPEDGAVRLAEHRPDRRGGLAAGRELQGPRWRRADADARAGAGEMR